MTMRSAITNIVSERAQGPCEQHEITVCCEGGLYSSAGLKMTMPAVDVRALPQHVRDHLLTALIGALSPDDANRGETAADRQFFHRAVDEYFDNPETQTLTRPVVLFEARTDFDTVLLRSPHAIPGVSRAFFTPESTDGVEVSR